MEDTWKQSMYSNVKFYEKDNEVHEIYFLVRLGGLKDINVASENSNTSDFNEIKIIWLMFTGSPDLYLGVYTGFELGLQ